ncbi:MAG: hypothetical protein FJZ16_00755 [Candidatus Omnitrophica bacterium]|nr:hypothetical protein [Candidatus Omnitrophota bacterium]
MKRYLIDNKGAGIIEIAITMVIFLILIGMLYGAISSNRVTVNEAQDKVKLQQEARKTLDRLEKELRASRNSLVTISPTNDSVTFQVPVDWDSDGDVVDAIGAVEWGAEGNLNWTIQYLLGGINNQQILKRVFNTAGIQQGTDTVIANDIGSFQITRQIAQPNRIIINLTAQRTTLDQRTLSFNAGTEILLRN